MGFCFWEEQMKQLPGAFYSEVHGPVFAYLTRDERSACCVTWRDQYVVLGHDALLAPPPYEVPGTAVIEALSTRVAEAMSPHVDDGSLKFVPCPHSHVGEAVF